VNDEKQHVRMNEMEATRCNGWPFSWRSFRPGQAGGAL